MYTIVLVHMNTHVKAVRKKTVDTINIRESKMIVSLTKAQAEVIVKALDEFTSNHTDDDNFYYGIDVPLLEHEISNLASHLRFMVDVYSN